MKLLRRLIAKIKLRPDIRMERDYLECISDLVNHEKVQSMKNFLQHGRTDCLAHSLYVSYYSYVLCKKMRFNYQAAARGALLHDFFLYDWHGAIPYEGWHGPKHPQIALQNARACFCLNELEEEIISRHMWPLTLRPPVSKEAYVVWVIDKYCSVLESVST